MEKKIAIIDPVGAKAGMNYYDVSLLKGLCNHGVKTYLYSNFISSSPQIASKEVFGQFYESKHLQGINMLSGVVKSCFDCRRNGVKKVLLHLFSTQIMTFLVFCIVRLFGLKIIVISHDVSSFAKDDKPFLKSAIYNWLCEKIVVHNDFSLRFLIPSLHQSKQEDIKVIKHGGYMDLPNDSITRDLARKELQFEKGTNYLLFFGQIKKVKRLDVALLAMANIKDNTKLVIAGKVWKDDFSRYERIIAENNLDEKVILDIQFISDEKRELYFKAADAMVLPYEEIFQSGVLLMGMSYGMLPIVSSIKPFEEIIEDGVNGIFFEAGKPKDLALKINQAFQDKIKVEEIKNMAIAKIEKEYAWDLIAEEYLDLLQ
jgi:D-inositol-3-phosphate glycosyltransferase|tara:strand:+ start:237 stop:1352 length:1116 start_codon:yes stop_codon:yes gene_type:complete